MAKYLDNIVFYASSIIYFIVRMSQNIAGKENTPFQTYSDLAVYIALAIVISIHIKTYNKNKTKKKEIE